MNLRRLFLIAVPLVAVAASVVIVGAGGGRSSVSAQSNATLALDMNPTNGDGPCNPIDAHASVARGSTFQVAICLTDAAEPPAAFNIELNYDNSVNECAPVECSDQLCFDGNPDANLGSTTWTDSGLGTACDCGSGGENPPTCDYNPGNDPNRTAFISCTCIETQTLPAGEGISGPIAMVTFKNVAEGSTDLAFGTVAFYPLQGPAMLRCPTAKCTGGSVDTNAASWFCSCGFIFSAIKSAVTCGNILAPSSAVRAKSDGVSSSSPIEIFSCAKIAPWSILASINIMVTPVSRSPFKIADCTGEAPRYFGKSDG